MRVLDVVKKQLSVLLVLIIIGEWFNPYICLANESKDEFDDELKAHSINLIEAEKEGMEDSIAQDNPFVIGKICNYSVLGDSVSLTQATEEEKSKIDKLKNTKKSWKNNWFLSRNYDNILFSEFHVRTQKDIRDNNNNIQKNELFIKLNSGKNKSADIWSVSDAFKEIYLWEVKPTSYNYEPNKSKGERQLAGYVDNRLKKKKVGNQEKYVDYKMIRGYESDIDIIDGEFYFDVTVDFDEWIEYVRYYVTYSCNNNSLIIYNFTRILMDKVEKPNPEPEEQSNIVKLSGYIESNQTIRQYADNVMKENSDKVKELIKKEDTDESEYTYKNGAIYLGSTIVISAAALTAGKKLADRIEIIHAPLVDKTSHSEQMVIAAETYKRTLEMVVTGAGKNATALVAAFDFLYTITLESEEVSAAEIDDSEIEDQMTGSIQNESDNYNRATKARPPVDPLIINLEFDNEIEITSMENGVNFDLDNNGFAEKTEWIGVVDGFLVLDRNNNGIRI